MITPLMLESCFSKTEDETINFIRYDKLSKVSFLNSVKLKIKSFIGNAMSFYYTVSF